MRLKNLAKSLTIDKNTWVYLEGKRISLVHEIRDKNGTYYRTVIIKIPFSKIKIWFK